MAIQQYVQSAFGFVDVHEFIKSWIVDLEVIHRFDEADQDLRRVRHLEILLVCDIAFEVLDKLGEDYTGQPIVLQLVLDLGALVGRVLIDALLLRLLQLFPRRLAVEVADV